MQGLLQNWSLSMPTYNYKCSECEHEFEMFLPIKDREVPVKSSCPECEKTKCVEQFLPVPPGAADPVRLGRTKPDKGFREVLQKIAQHHPHHDMKIR